MRAHFTFSRLILATVGCLLFSLSGAALAQPNTVSNWYVYNATLKGINGVAAKDNGFNANSKGWSWQQAGFLDANGKPYAVDATTGNIMNGTTIIGRATAPGVAFWTSTVNNSGVADLSGGATLQSVYDAILPFNNPNQMTGKLHLSVHGPPRSLGGGVLQPGGLITLDKNRTYSGFRQPGTNDNGTGAPIVTPYALVPKAAAVGATGGGRFALELYSCNTGLDPDAGGAMKSVAVTAATGFGRVETTPGNFIERVTAVTSSVPTVQCVVTPSPTNLPANVPVEDFVKAVLKKIKDDPKQFNKTKNVTDWLQGLPFDDHYSSIAAQLGTLTIPPIPATSYPGGDINVTWKLEYKQVTASIRGPGLEATDNPSVWSASPGDAVVQYRTPSGEGPDSDFTITSIVGGSSSAITMHLCAAADVPVTPPSPNLELATSVMRLSPYADNFTGVDGTATLDYGDDIDPSTLELYQLVGSQWIQFTSPGNRVLDESLKTIGANFSFDGLFDETNGAIVAGFAVPVPEPVSATIAITCLVLLGRRGRTNRRGCAARPASALQFDHSRTTK